MFKIQVKSGLLGINRVSVKTFLPSASIHTTTAIQLKQSMNYVNLLILLSVVTNTF